ncbi:IPT/TIG domain-containing protein [Anoxynatronum buryatiense]|uniref:IPT/TIG domain-containing protein n=1 Tax=Anoxynatronum buryatiense TaxID=489973 RepID=A0AA45WW00_9CLOT|nr:IPT/TIG domain-containing protein [Anoxynatronum buryatiense]SMP56595.1 IPT/TIG domain-containing protein [Anoxynatronum buryatiense]
MHTPATFHRKHSSPPHKQYRHTPRRAIAWMLLVAFFVTFLPLEPGSGAGVTSASAQELTQPILTITNNYENFIRVLKRVTVQDGGFSGTGITGHTMGVFDDVAGLYNVPANQLTVFGSLAQATIPDNFSGLRQVQVRFQRPDNTTETLEYNNVSEGIPEITGVVNPLVTGEDVIIVSGRDANVKDLANSSAGYIVRVGGAVARVWTNDDAADPDYPAGLTLTNSQVGLQAAPGNSFPGGLLTITVERSLQRLTTSNSLRNLYNYVDAVRVITPLNLDGMTMFPTLGEVGSRVRFTWNNQMPANGYDVYFVEDLTNLTLLTPANRAGFVSNPAPQANGDWIYTVTVPNVDAGRAYYVVLTPRGNTDSRYVMNQQYRVISIQDSPVIDNFSPASAPSLQPTEVTITGGFFSRLNIDGLDYPVQEMVVPAIPSTGLSELTVEYIPEASASPVINLGGILAPVKSVERSFQVVIDNTLRIYDFTPQSGTGAQRDNTFKVMTETYTITQPREVPVSVEVLTTITLDDVNETQLVIEQIVISDGKFTFIPSTEAPQVEEVIPRIIPIERLGDNDYLHSSLEELMLVIRGDGFLVTRYMSGGQEQVNYPKVRLGQMVIDPNAAPGAPGVYVPESFQVLRGSTLVDGIGNNETGNTLVIRLRAGSEGFEVIERNDRSIAILNPRRGSGEFPDDAFFINFPEKVEFREIGENDFPRIISVIPNLVSLEGGVPVRITGSNFRPGTQVFIEGRLVPGITVSGDAETIDFTAPAGNRAGETQLQVVNPEGGLATYPFTYTTTFTEPRLTRIAPTEGTEGTLVTVQGSNFLRPDPTVRVTDLNNIDVFIMNRLIGTRFFMGAHDINTYNREGNRVALTPYHEGAAPDRTLKDHVFIYSADTGQWRAGEGFESVIFYNETSRKFYRLIRDVQNRYWIEDGLGLRYQIRRNGGNFQAVSGTNTYNITQSTKGVLSFDGKTLRAYTPYFVSQVDGFDTITGNRVTYIDGSTLNIRVPNMGIAPWTGAGLYDVAVVNPDTKEARLTNAFYYYPEPRTIPAIRDIVPEIGPEAGGNLVNLKLDDTLDVETGFVDTGTSKTKVFVGAQQVPAADVVVSPNGQEIRIKVPAFYENIRDKGTDRVTVPLVLVNPDGGTFHVDFNKPITVQRTRRTAGGTEDYSVDLFGYTYVVPTSNPRIDSISPVSGSAAGRYVVEIFGFDFRDFRNIRDEDGNITETLNADPDNKGTSLYNDQYQVLLDELYPQIYFGNQEAEIVVFSPTYLQVVVGPNAGAVPVYVVNNDSGISNTLSFTFDSSQPAITSVNPDRADRRGGTLVEILGQGFEESLITLLMDTDGTNGASQRLTNQNKAMVRVGQRTNKNLPREDENSGVIRSGRATVRLAGEVTARYDAGGTGTLEVSIVDRGTTYNHEYRGFQSGETVYIDTTHLTNNSGEAYPYRELIRFEVRENRLFVEGGYAPEVLYRTPRHLVATMPAYYTTGTVRLSVVNPDGGTASRDFVYITPDSRPVITNITREGRDPLVEQREGYGEIRVQKVSLRGGNVISILGTDFREDARINIGDVVNIGPQDITYNLPNRLTFTMPSLPENTVGSLYRGVVTNVDGGSATSDRAEPTPIYIEITKGESDPRLDTITPAEGPVTGGTRITLTGNDFRKTMEGYEQNPLNVFFGEARVEDGSGNLEYVDYRQIKVTAPAGNTFGNVNVRVENPDGELSLPPGQFRYISQPNIATMDPARIFANDGESDVTVTGEMFISGAKVILGGRLIRKGQEPAGETVHGEGVRGVDDNGNNLYFSVVGGVPASTVNVTSENVMVLRFPEVLDLQNDDLIIINPDGGLSDPYSDFDYAIPVPDKPLVLEAIPGAESSVQLVWSQSGPEVLNASDRFEVYGKKSSDAQFTYLGDTQEADFLVRGLEPDTRYDFRVRALNRYGSAIETAEASTRTFSLRDDPKLGEKIEELDRQQEELETKGKEEIAGSRVVRTVGSREIPAGTTPYVIDFSGAQYSRQNDFVVAFPVSALGTMNRPVRITDGSASLTITPSHLLTREVSGLSSDQQKDAVVQVQLKRLEGQEATAMTSAVTRTQRRASGAYGVGFNLRAGRNEQNLPRLLGNASLTIALNTGVYQGSSTTNTALMVYDPASHKFNSVGSTTATFRESGIYQLISNR